MTTVYRHFDRRGNLLYVGVSSNMGIRTLRHERCAFWWRQVAYIKVEHFRFRRDAVKAENLAIKTENPKLNGFTESVLFFGNDNPNRPRDHYSRCVRQIQAAKVANRKGASK